MVAVSFIEWAKHRTVSFYNQLHSFLSLLTEQYPPFIPTPVFRISPVFSSFHHRFGFTRCKGRPSHLIRWLEVHFLLAKFFLTGVRVIFQGKPPYEVFPTAVYRIRKTPKRFRKKEPTKGKISINNFKKLRLCLIM